MLADSRFSCQHQAVCTIKQSIINVVDFSTRGDRGNHHRFEKIGSYINRSANLLCGLDNSFLGNWKAFDRHLAGKVTAVNQDRVRRSRDIHAMGQPTLAFDLCDDVRVIAGKLPQKINIARRVGKG